MVNSVILSCLFQHDRVLWGTHCKMLIRDGNAIGKKKTHHCTHITVCVLVSRVWIECLNAFAMHLLGSGENPQFAADVSNAIGCLCTKLSCGISYVADNRRSLVMRIHIQWTTLCNAEKCSRCLCGHPGGGIDYPSAKIRNPEFDFALQLHMPCDSQSSCM